MTLMPVRVPLRVSWQGNSFLSYSLATLRQGAAGKRNAETGTKRVAAGGVTEDDLKWPKVGEVMKLKAGNEEAMKEEGETARKEKDGEGGRDEGKGEEKPRADWVREADAELARKLKEEEEERARRAARDNSKRLNNAWPGAGGKKPKAAKKARKKGRKAAAAAVLPTPAPTPEVLRRVVLTEEHSALINVPGPHNVKWHTLPKHQRPVQHPPPS